MKLKFVIAMTALSVTTAFSTADLPESGSHLRSTPSLERAFFSTPTQSPFSVRRILLVAITSLLGSASGQPLRITGNNSITDVAHNGLGLDTIYSETFPSIAGQFIHHPMTGRTTLFVCDSWREIDFSKKLEGEVAIKDSGE